MERETVPDTEDYILLDKIGMGMGVYSGVYEYTQQIQEQILSIQSIQVFGAFAELQAGSLQYNILICRLGSGLDWIGQMELPGPWHGLVWQYSVFREVSFARWCEGELSAMFCAQIKQWNLEKAELS